MRFIATFLVRHKLAVFSFLIINLVIILYLTYGAKNSTTKVVAEIQQKQFLLSELAASKINSIVIDSIQDLNKTTAILKNDKPSDIYQVLDKNSSSTTKLHLINSQGQLLDSNNQYQPSPEAKAILDEYVAKSQYSQTAYIGSPHRSQLNDPKDFFVPISTAINIEGQPLLLLSAHLSIDTIANDYFDAFKLNRNSRVYLVDHEGVMLYSPFPETQGINYFDYLNKRPFIGFIISKYQLNKSLSEIGPGSLSIPLPNNKTNSISRMLIYHNSVTIPNHHWTIAVATPLEDTGVNLLPFQIRNTLLVLEVLLTFFFVISLLRYPNKTN